MSDLLPVLFARGQNQSIDPRVAPPDVHNVAQNVRWRKDGRPAKRFGLSKLSSVGLDAGGSVYASHDVNFASQWRGQPMLGLGAGVRRLIGVYWSDVSEANTSQIPHFAPGRHDPIARAEITSLANGTVAYANGYVLYAWDDGTSVWYQVTNKAGAILFSGMFLATGIYPRAVAVGNLIYIVFSNTTLLAAATFDTTTLTITTVTNLTTLGVTGQYYDAIGRATDWLLIAQTGASVITAGRYNGATTPALQANQSITTSTSSGNFKVAIGGSSTSVVFAAWLEPTVGKIRFQAFTNNLVTTVSSITTVDTDTNNQDQPSIVIDDNNDGGLFWGGLAASGAYLRYCDIANTGAGGSVTNVQHVRPCSKPFYGNADSFAHDGRFIWAHTDNGTGTGTGLWDDQRTYYLMWANSINAHPKFAMWTPRMTASVYGSTAHMSDVVSDGSGTSNTTFWTVMNASIRADPIVHDLIGIDSVSFSSIFARQREAARDTVTAGRALQIAGGMLYEFNGSTEESGFMHAPVILSATATSGGTLTASSDYIYVAVYEWIDSQGRRHRSAPSDPVSMTTTFAASTGNLIITTLAGFSRLKTPSIHIYRTLAGGTTYHRVTPGSGAPSAYGSGSTLTYADNLSDALAELNEFVYTDGGVVENWLPPPCQFMAVCGGRVWLGGQLDRNVITSSKILVDGEPTQFTEEDEFSVFLPEECTGIAAMDGTVVAFAKEALYLVTGDGPSNEGIGGYNPPQKLPTDVGCIDWRSVVETSIGIFFQSLRGIFLLPRGFNTPVFVGADIEDTLTTYPICKSATLVSVPASNDQLGEVTVRYVMADTEAGTNAVCCVYDLRVQGWSVDISPDSATLGPGGTWLDTFVQTKYLSGTASAWFETNLGYDDHGLFVPTTLGTGDIRPFGIAGYGQFKRVVVLGEYRGDSVVQVSTSVDGATPDVSSFTVTSPDGPDGVVYLDVTPRIFKGSSLRVTVADSTTGSATEGFIAQAILIEIELIGKTERLAQGRKA